jgi:hypothetical protein
MLQVVQDISSGKTTVRHLPDPIAPAGHVVVANAASLVSAGTERYVVELARKSSHAPLARTQSRRARPAPSTKSRHSAKVMALTP